YQPVSTNQPLAVVLDIILTGGTTSPQIIALSLHDALPIYRSPGDPDRAVPRAGQHRSRDRDARGGGRQQRGGRLLRRAVHLMRRDRKSTRLNSSHVKISYAVFCLKKKRRQGRSLQKTNLNS